MKKLGVVIFIMLLLFNGCRRIGYTENVVYSEKSLENSMDSEKEKAASRENAIVFSKYNFEKIFGIDIDKSNMYENVILIEDTASKKTLWKIIWESDQSEVKYYSTVDSKNNEILSMGFYYTKPPAPLDKYSVEKVNIADKKAYNFLYKLGLNLNLNLNLSIRDYTNIYKPLYNTQDGMFYISFINIENNSNVIKIIVNPNTDEVVGFSKE